jgi:hypothetical protein
LIASRVLSSGDFWINLKQSFPLSLTKSSKVKKNRIRHSFFLKNKKEEAMGDKSPKNKEKRKKKKEVVKPVVTPGVITSTIKK